MSRTVYVKFTLGDDHQFESMSLEEVATWFLLCLGPSCIGGPDVTVWDTLPNIIAAEIDLDQLLNDAIDWVNDNYEAWLQNPTENPPTVAGTLIKLLKGRELP